MDKSWLIKIVLLFRGSFVVVLAIGAFAMSVAAQTSKAIETELLRHLNNIEKWSGNGGTRNEVALEKENKILKQSFLSYGRKAATLKYDFTTLARKMFVTTSKDGKLRIYSWDSRTGGSADWFENVFQYLAGNGKAKSWTPKIVEGEVCPPFYHQIFQTETLSGRIYLANSTSICSNSLAVQDLSIFRIDGEKLDSNVRLIQTKTGLTNSIRFEYDFFSVVDHPERPIKLFFFDEAKRSFRFPVVIEDEQTPQGRVTTKFITYNFNGKYFAKVR